MNLQGSTRTIETLYIRLDEKSKIIPRYVVEDNELKAAIINRLKLLSRVPIEKTTITVKDGYLKLEGEVPWAYQRVVTSSMLENINGLKGITNNIKVVPYMISLG